MIAYSANYACKFCCILNRQNMLKNQQNTYWNLHDCQISGLIFFNLLEFLHKDASTLVTITYLFYGKIIRNYLMLLQYNSLRNLKKISTRWQDNLRGRNRDADIENGLVTQLGSRSVGRTESRIDMESIYSLCKIYSQRSISHTGSHRWWPRGTGWVQKGG